MVQIVAPIAGFLVIAGSWLLYNNASQRKIGSILTLVFSAVSFNFIGLVLGVLGGFLGLTWKSTTTTKTTTTSQNSSGRSGNPPKGKQGGHPYGPRRDRKSTRLNSSHVNISYAVCCV